MSKIEFSKLSEDDKKDLAHRLTLAKKRQLWAVEITYKSELNSVSHHRIVNRTGGEILKLRTDLFSTGVMVPADGPGHWQVISPLRLLEVHVYQQDHYIE